MKNKVHRIAYDMDQYTYYDNKCGGVRSGLTHDSIRPDLKILENWKCRGTLVSLPAPAIIMSHRSQGLKPQMPKNQEGTYEQKVSWTSCNI